MLLTIGATGALLGVDGSTAAAATPVSSASAGTLRTCPRTGCTASTCHAETGQSPYAQ
jgi:hypothetical protein